MLKVKALEISLSTDGSFQSNSWIYKLQLESNSTVVNRPEIGDELSLEDQDLPDVEAIPSP